MGYFIHFLKKVKKEKSLKAGREAAPGR